MEKLNSIFYILSGSFVGFLIKEIFNQINKKLDFDREIVKHVYEKKLDKAEKTVAFYWAYIARLTEIKKSLEIMVEVSEDIDNHDTDIQFLITVINNSSQLLGQLTLEKYIDAQSIHLYFNLDNSWSENDTKNLIKKLGDAKAFDNKMQMWFDLYSKNINSDKLLADSYLNNGLKILPAYSNLLKEIIELADKDIGVMFRSIETIKKEIKKRT